MIEVSCIGHIKTSLGREKVVLDADELTAPELIDRLRAQSLEKNPGFTRFNTLAMVGDSEAFLPASTDRKIRAGDRVVLIPFSHGG